MTMRLDENDHVVNVWFADDVDGNNLVVILRRRENQHVMEVRVRQKVDEKVYDSKDKRTHYRMTFKNGITEETALVMCNSFWVMSSEKYCMHQINQRVDGGVEKFTKTMQKYEAFHCKEIPIDSDSKKEHG